MLLDLSYKKNVNLCSNFLFDSVNIYKRLLWCWWRLLRVPWTARRSNQSILKEISPGCSLEGLMLKLKLQYFGHLMWRVDSLEKTLMLGGIGGRGEGDDRGWDGWMASPTQWTWVWIDSGSLWWTGRPGMLRFMGSQRIGHDWVTELNRLLCMSCFLNFILGLSVSCQNNTQGCPFRVFNLDRMLAVDAVEEIASWGGSFNTISL